MLIETFLLCSPSLKTLLFIVKSPPSSSPSPSSTDDQSSPTLLAHLSVSTHHSDKQSQGSIDALVNHLTSTYPPDHSSPSYQIFNTNIVLSPPSGILKDFILSSPQLCTGLLTSLTDTYLEQHRSTALNNAPAVRLLTIFIHPAPYYAFHSSFRWSVKLCAELVIYAQAVLKKAVILTLGGAYATLRRVDDAEAAAVSLLKLAHMFQDALMAAKARLYLGYAAYSRRNWNLARAIFTRELNLGKSIEALSEMTELAHAALYRLDRAEAGNLGEREAGMPWI